MKAQFNPDIEIPEGYEEIIDNIIFKAGDKYYNFVQFTFVEVSGILLQQTRASYSPNCIFIRPINNNLINNEFSDILHLIPDGFEINNDDECLIKDGDYFIPKHENKLHKFLGWEGRRIGYSKVLGVRIVLKKIESPEIKINKLKEKARNFVNKNIKNATKKTYLKFEETFLREDNFGT